MTARRRRVRLKTATFERATRAVQDVSLRRFGIVSTVMALVLVAQAPASAQYGSVIVTRDVMIPVRDGKLMATDLYRPVANGGVVTSKLPVLLNRTPYARETLAASARYFAQRGYVVAVQSLRGRYTSQGSFASSAKSVGSWRLG